MQLRKWRLALMTAPLIAAIMAAIALPAQATEARGMYLYSSGCRTAKLAASYPSSTPHMLTTCYEKWAQAGTRNWVYYRWADWQQAKPSGLSAAVTLDFTIRSRPWKGQEYKVANVTSYSSVLGGSNCNNIATVSLNFSASVGVSIPIHQCSAISRFYDASQHSIMADFNGKTKGVLHLDYAITIVAADTRVVPTFADYAWAEIEYCTRPVLCRYPSQYIVDRDAGW
jgi:hypothetical protein